MGSIRDPNVIIDDAPPGLGQEASNLEPLDLKTEPDHGLYDSPSDSSPEPEASASAEPSTDKTSQDPAPPVKRKGGRKPVCSTALDDRDLP